MPKLRTIIGAPGNMRKYLHWALVITGIVCGACDDDDDGDVINATDRDFVLQVSEGNLAEVELGQLAATKSTTLSVQEFGQMMVMEHTLAQTKLDSIADRHGIETSAALNAKHQELKQLLSTLSGYSFDTAYMNSQVRDHELTESRFQTEIANGSHEGVRWYANKFLPNIQLHLHHADSIASAIQQ